MKLKKFKANTYYNEYIFITMYGKSLEERIKLFESTIYFRNANNIHLIDDKIKNEMNGLLNKLRKKFEDENFYYTMSVLYYIAKK